MSGGQRDDRVHAFPVSLTSSVAGKQCREAGFLSPAGFSKKINYRPDPMYYELISQMKKQLSQMDKWFEAAAQHGQLRSFSPDVLLHARLAPDQFPLSRQIQIACDTLKLGIARLTGKDVPKHEDNETTLEALRARVKSVIELVDSLTPADFAAAAERSVSQPRWEGKTMSGADYFVEHMLPNFYFHTGHVYALLRHNGVTLGKRDYLGQLTMRDPA
jgi:hypothetical protein